MLFEEDLSREIVDRSAWWAADLAYTSARLFGSEELLLEHDLQ